MLHKLRQDQNYLTARTDALRPVRAPGGLTSHTTRGVIRRPTARSIGSNRTPTNFKPRWG